MNRRHFLQSISIGPSLVTVGEPSEKKFHSPSPIQRPLLPHGGVKPLTMGLDHVLIQLGDSLICRKPPASVAELNDRRGEVREALLESLGLNPFPPRTSLNARVVGRSQRSGYSIEKIIFESRPDFFVPANVYVPDNIRGRVPAIVFPVGHWMATGKEDPTHAQAGCIGLARRGYVVLAYDPIGQGERRLPGNHHSLGFTSFLWGSCNMGWMVWDSMRAIDYLLTRPDVESEKIGITGASGGGANSFYATAVDERIRAAVVVVFACTFLEWFRYGGDNCICDHLPGFMGRYEEFEIYSMMAPRPVLLLNSIPDDGYPVSGARVSFEAAKQIYRLANAAGQVGYRELQTPHGYLAPEREAMYGWFDYYLQGRGSREPQTEEPFQVEPVGSEVLRCFKENPPANAKTMIDINREVYKALRAQSTSRPKLQSPEKVIQIFGGFPEKTPLYGVDLSSPKAAPSAARSIVFRSETGIAIPAFLLPSHVKEAEAVVLFLDPAGKQRVFENPLSAALLEAGLHVFAVDVRGFGETGNYPGQKGYPDEFQCCTDSAGLGKPILGQRVWDIVRGLDYLGQNPLTQGRQVLVYGEGVGANIALFAAALDQRITAVATSRALLSYRPAIQAIHDSVELYNTDTSELVTAEARIHYSLFVPGLLKVSDLPEIHNLILPRGILAANPLLPEDFSEIRRKLPGIVIFEKLIEPKFSIEISRWLKSQVKSAGNPR